MVPSRRKRSSPGAADERNIEQLDRGPPLEPSIGPFREPDRAHAAPPDRSDQAVGAEDLPRERLLERRTIDRRNIAFEEMRRLDGLVLGEQHPEVGCERGVVCPDEAEPGRTFVRGDIERLVQQRAQLAPAFRAE